MKKTITQKLYTVIETKTVVTKYTHKRLAQTPEEAIENLNNRNVREDYNTGRLEEDLTITTDYEVIE